MKKIATILLVFTVAVSITSCKKSTTTPTPSNTPPTVTPPSNAYGALIAVISKSNTTVAGITVPLEIGLAVAWFGSAGAYLDAGNVSCKGNALIKTNNAYTYQPSGTNATGIDFSSSSVLWNVTGSSGVSAFSYDDVSSFPTLNDITSSTEISTGSSYILTASSLSGAQDSVIFNISGPKANILKVKPASTSSCTFSAAEMATLGTGSNAGVIQVAPYKVNGQVINAKQYYFIKETCVTKFINLK